MDSHEDEIARYLESGASDMLHLTWPGDSIVARACNGNKAIRNALIAEIMKRTRYSEIPEQLVNLNVTALAEQKIAPMLRGLFPADEQGVLMEMFSLAGCFLIKPRVGVRGRGVRLIAAGLTAKIDLAVAAGPHSVVCGVPDKPARGTAVSARASWHITVPPRPTSRLVGADR